MSRAENCQEKRAKPKNCGNTPNAKPSLHTTIRMTERKVAKAPIAAKQSLHANQNRTFAKGPREWTSWWPSCVVRGCVMRFAVCVGSQLFLSGEFGFAEALVRKSVDMCGLDKEHALDWLLNNASAADEPAPVAAVPLAPPSRVSPPPPLVAESSPLVYLSGIPEAPPQPPVEPFKLQEGFIPPPPPPPPEPMMMAPDGSFNFPAPPAAPAASSAAAGTGNEFLDKIAQTASVRGSSNSFHPKGAAGRVGLQNQGATCYLNSLLQTLYLDPSFRSILYSFRYDEKKDGDKALCIPFQLQLLFAELQIGENGVAKTGPLTDAFGWKDGQQYQQHDVQELMRVLVNAVELSFKEKESDADSVVAPLFSGTLDDYLECLVCHHKKSRHDPFSDLQLFVEKADSLEQAFANFVTAETLDGGNQVSCDKCAKKVDASKGLRILAVPPVLTLQLKRFTYDPVTWQRVKLSKRVTYPLYLDASKLINTATIDSTAPMGQDERPQVLAPDSQWYELFSVLIHSGGALGGHYYAYCKDVTQNAWYNFNDMDVRSITEKDALAMSGAEGQNSVSSTNAYMLLYRKMIPGEVFDGIEADRIPPYIKALIETENDEIKDKKTEYEQAMKYVTVNVYQTAAVDCEPVTVQLDRKLIYTEAGRAAATALHLPVDGFDFRLMGFIPKRGKLSSESFVGREKDTLQGLGFHNNKNVLLQRKAMGEEWPLDIPSFQLEIVLANQGRERFEPPRFVAVRADAKVRQLMNLIHAIYWQNGLFRSRDDVALVRIHGESFEHTSRGANWHKPLQELGIVDGCRVYAETRLKRGEEGFEKINWDKLVATDEATLKNLDEIYAPVKEEDSPKVEEQVSEWNSFVVQQFEIQRNTIEISYNIPKEGADENAHVVMDQMIEIDQRLPLKELRRRLALALSVDLKSFIIRKNLDKKEYRDDEASLAELKIYTGNALLLQSGTPLTSEFCKVRLFFLDCETADEPIFVGDLAAKRVASLGELKEQMAAALGERRRHAHVRISEKMGTKLSRTVLGDDDMLVEKAIPHIRDGFELCCETMAEKDTFGPDDFILHVKRWNKEGSGLLQQGCDQMVVSRTATIQQIKNGIAGRFGVPVERVMLSKPFRSLLAQLSTVLEAVQSVHWDVDAESIAAKSPWYLSNGELVMWKDKQDVEKHVQFLESIYGPNTSSPAVRAPEPALKIMSKFDRAAEAASAHAAAAAPPASTTTET